jgi:hypothetical protein
MGGGASTIHPYNLTEDERVAILVDAVSMNVQYMIPGEEWRVRLPLYYKR